MMGEDGVQGDQKRKHMLWERYGHDKRIIHHVFVPRGVCVCGGGKGLKLRRAFGPNVNRPLI